MTNPGSILAQYEAKQRRIATAQQPYVSSGLRLPGENRKPANLLISTWDRPLHCERAVPPWWWRLGRSAWGQLKRRVF